MRKLSDIRKSVGYHSASAKADFVSEVHALLEQKGLKQKDLATAMGVPASQISRMLRGDQNLTLDTMVMVAAALDRTLRVHLARRGVALKWHEVEPLTRIGIAASDAPQSTDTLTRDWGGPPRTVPNSATGMGSS